MAPNTEHTVDHDRIREWTEARGGEPATVKGTEEPGEAAGLLRIDFPGHGEDANLEHISWEDWFAKFDEADLVMIVQETTEDGSMSRFKKIVSRETAATDSERS